MMSRGVWISNPLVLAAIGAGAFAIVFLVAWHEIRGAITELLHRD